MTQRERVDKMIEDFDEVRKRHQPTNGECLGVFIVLAADIIAESPPDVADELLRPARAVLNTHGLDPEAMTALFQRCGLPMPQRKKPSRL